MGIRLRAYRNRQRANHVKTTLYEGQIQFVSKLVKRIAITHLKRV